MLRGFVLRSCDAGLLFRWEIFDVTRFKEQRSQPYLLVLHIVSIHAPRVGGDVL